MECFTALLSTAFFGKLLLVFVKKAGRRFKLLFSFCHCPRSRDTTKKCLVLGAVTQLVLMLLDSLLTGLYDGEQPCHTIASYYTTYY